MGDPRQPLLREQWQGRRMLDPWSPKASRLGLWVVDIVVILFGLLVLFTCGKGDLVTKPGPPP